MADYVDEGATSYHTYTLTKADGVTPVDNLEGLKYKVTDGVDDLVPFSALPLIATGTITVHGTINRLSSPNRRYRYVLLFATHNGGEHLPKQIRYTIRDLITVTPDMEPTT